MGPLGLGNRVFDSYTINFLVLVFAPSLGIKISVGTTGNCEDCVMGGECVRLVWRLLYLWRRWWGRVGFSLDLRIGVVWHWVCFFGTTGGYVIICGVGEG
jgi:hypothetical protein